eukprot:TRINITY_DN9256_c0_g1_i1.p1 TRINITY_DN9256_c0_g1~~TRINITY_DN9256_c0_g1_i1.p1  ORF type:complete len:279 (-),score=14.72 TRINITY_DN9256_c0_g1_i1:220-1056(-)
MLFSFVNFVIVIFVTQVIFIRAQEFQSCPLSWTLEMVHAKLNPTYGPGNMTFNATIQDFNEGYIGVPQVRAYRQDSGVSGQEEGHVNKITGCDAETECCTGGIIVEGSMRLRNPYQYRNTSLTIAVQGDTCSGAGQSGCYISETFVHPPTCALYAVDCSYCGAEGLVTDDNKAGLVLACTHPVDICDDCIGVKGPANANLESLSLLYNTQSFYSIVINWEEDYQGKVEIGVICDLKSIENGAYLDQPVIPASFRVMPKGSVLVKTTAFRVNNYTMTSQ